MDKTIIILAGLSGCGKTTFLKELLEQEKIKYKLIYGEDPKIHAVVDWDKEKYNNDVLYESCGDTIFFNMDRIIEVSHKSIICIQDVFEIKEYHDLYMNYDTFIFDGNYYNNKLYKNFVECFNGDNIIIYFWEEDRESCLFNNRYRKDSISIENLVLEEPDINMLWSYNPNIEIRRMKTERKSNYKLFLEKYISIKNKHLKSQPWCYGGTECYYNSMKEIEEEDPIDIKEWRELMKILRDFKTIKLENINSILAIKSYIESDKWGGSVEYRYYSIEIEKLYKILEKEFLEIEGTRNEKNNIVARKQERM